MAAEQALDATTTFPPFKAMAHIANAMVQLRSGNLQSAREYLENFATSEFYRVLIDIYFYHQYAYIELARQSGDISDAMQRSEEFKAEVELYGPEIFHSAQPEVRGSPAAGAGTTARS